MAHDVFISYSSKDKPTADATCATLESLGIRCWIAPRDIVPGADWGETIVEAIQASRVFVLVFSANANLSVQIKREVERAINKGIPVIPLRIENVMPAKSLEYFLSTPHWLDAFNPPLERHLNYLAEVIRGILDGRAAAPRVSEGKPTVAGMDRRVVIGGAAGVLGAGIAGWFFLRPPPSFVGKWTAARIDVSPDSMSPFGMYSISIFLKAAEAGHKLTGNLEIGNIGQYTFDWGGDDTGTVAANGAGVATFTSDITHDSTDFSYIRMDGADANGAISMLGGKAGDSAIALTAPATEESLLVGTPLGNSSDAIGPLVGHWYTHTPANGALGAVTTALDITSDGHYHYRFDISESGLWQASNGNWTRTPQAALPVSGTYQFHGSDQVTCAASSGVTVWERAD
jgi:hypothetical protein